MQFTISYKDGGAYSRSLAVIRKHLEAVCNGALILKVVTHGRDDGALEIRLNAADLYIGGFRDAEGGPWYRFGDVHDWGGTTPLKFGGTHRELGTTLEGTVFNGSTPYKIANLAHFDETNQNDIRLTLSFLVVSISEALRFPEVEKALLETVFTTTGTGSPSYRPGAKHHRQLMTEWASLSKAGSERVAIRHVGPSGSRNAP